MADLKQNILTHLKEKNMEMLKTKLSEAEPIEILYILHDLTPDEKVVVFRLLSKENALYIFEQLEPTLQYELIKSFTDERAIELINEMTPDDRVSLFEELPATVTKKLLSSISPDERQVTNILMGYAPETAGRIMTTEYTSLKRDMSVEEALEKIRKESSQTETIYTLYITDSQKNLEGVLSLKDLVIAKADAKINDIMSTTIIKVSTNTDQEEVANTLKELDLLAIPVVDKENRLVGIVTIDDAMDILEEEATEDIYDQAGFADITGNETNRSNVLINGSLFQIWKVRMPFLFITLVAGFAAGAVVGGFEETLEAVAAVAIFIPLIMDMGGNVGTQSSTLFVRGVILGHIKVKYFLKHFLKETLVGFSIGTVIGILAAAVAIVWQGNVMLAIAVGISLVLTMTLAAMLGFFVPFILIKFNVDQTAGSAPIITSIKDIAGLTIYFVLVSYFLGNLL